MKHNEDNVLDISFITQELNRAELPDKAKRCLLSKNPRHNALQIIYNRYIFKPIKKQCKPIGKHRFKSLFN